MARTGTVGVRIGEPFDPSGLSPQAIVARVEKCIEKNTSELEAAAAFSPNA